MVNRPFATIAVLLSIVAVALATHKQTFTYVSLDGRHLRMLVQGNGPVTVVFENGLGPPLEMWGKVQPAVSAFARTVTYDRAGVGLSDAGPLPRDARHIADDLHRALQVARIQPPYVLVGASLGGPYVRVSAGLYPAEVAGIVLVDPEPDSAHIDGARSPEARALSETLNEAKTSSIPAGVPVLLIRAEGEAEVPFATRSIRAARLAHRPAIAAESLEDKAWVGGIADGTMIVTSDSGHNVEIEQPDLVIATIRRAVELARSNPKRKLADDWRHFRGLADGTN